MWDLLGGLILPLGSFLFLFVTFFQEKPQMAEAHGGILIFGVGYFFVYLFLVMPISLMFSIIHHFMLSENKHWIKVIPLGGWLLFTFYLQCPLFNKATDYRRVDSLDYSLIYLGLITVFMIAYYYKIKKINNLTPSGM